MKAFFRSEAPGAGDYLRLGLFLAGYLGLAAFIMTPHHGVSQGVAPDSAAVADQGAAR